MMLNNSIVENREKAHERYELLDIIRGITLISMIMYHASWDLVYLFGKSWTWYASSLGYVWQQSICWSFIFLSGFCLPFGKNHIKRGFQVFLGGAVISIATLLFMYESRIIFGVLTFLGTAMLLTAIVLPLLNRINIYIGFFTSSCLFFIFRNVDAGSLGFEGIILGSVPSVLYRNIVTTFLGFPKAGFFSTDYFPLIPWIFLFLAGFYFHGIMRQNQRFSSLHSDRFVVLQWIGRHSLILYMIHQPAVYGIFLLLHSAGILV